MDDNNVLGQLIEMSREIGRPENDYVILGEGNTSARLDGGRFYVKASGTQLCRATEDSFVEVSIDRALALLDAPELAGDRVKDSLAAARVDQSSPLRPSIETAFHAYLLTLPGVNFVAHTHPTSVNSILFSVNAEKIVTSRLCVHEVIYCGVEPVFVPSTSPGLGLARSIREKVSAYLADHGCPPRQIFLQEPRPDRARRNPRRLPRHHRHGLQNRPHHARSQLPRRRPIPQPGRGRENI